MNYTQENFKLYINKISAIVNNRDVTPLQQKFLTIIFLNSQIRSEEFTIEVQKCLDVIQSNDLKVKINEISNLDTLASVCEKIYNYELKNELTYIEPSLKIQLFFDLKNKEVFSKELIQLFVDKRQKDLKTPIEEVKLVKPQKKVAEPTQAFKHKFWIQLILSLSLLLTVISVWFYYFQYQEMFVLMDQLIKKNHAMPTYVQYMKIISEQTLSTNFQMTSKIVMYQLGLGIILLIFKFIYKLKSKLLLWTAITLIFAIFLSFIGAILIIILIIICLFKQKDLFLLSKRKDSKDY